MESGKNSVRALSRPSMLLDTKAISNTMMSEELTLADSVSRQSRASEIFKESLFSTFRTIKGFMDELQIQQMDERQQTLEERHEGFKQLCVSNFKNGSYQLQYLLKSTDHLIG